MLVYQENRTMCRPGLNSAMQAQFPDALCRSICTRWPEGKTNSRYYRNAANWVQRSPGHPRKSGKIHLTSSIFKSFYHEMYWFFPTLERVSCGFHLVFPHLFATFVPPFSTGTLSQDSSALSAIRFCDSALPRDPSASLSETWDIHPTWCYGKWA